MVSAMTRRLSMRISFMNGLSFIGNADDADDYDLYDFYFLSVSIITICVIWVLLYLVLASRRAHALPAQRYRERSLRRLFYLKCKCLILLFRLQHRQGRLQHPHAALLHSRADHLPYITLNFLRWNF